MHRAVEQPCSPDTLQRAADPATPSAHLERLAAHPDPRVPRAVACNPGAPRDLALSLLETYPAEGLLNPALPLWLLEQPDLLRERPRAVAAVLTIEPPDWLVGALQRYWDEQSIDPLYIALGKWLARRRDTPVWLLGRLCASGNAGTRRMASQQPQAPPRVLELLRAAGSDAELRSPVRRRPPVSAAQLREAAALGAWGAQLAASHPRAPRDLLCELSFHPNPGVLEALARRPSLPAEALARLFDRSSDRMLKAMQDNRLPRSI